MNILHKFQSPKFPRIRGNHVTAANEKTGRQFQFDQHLVS